MLRESQRCQKNVTKRISQDTHPRIYLLISVLALISAPLCVRKVVDSNRYCPPCVGPVSPIEDCITFLSVSHGNEWKNVFTIVQTKQTNSPFPFISSPDEQEPDWAWTHPRPLSRRPPSTRRCHACTHWYTLVHTVYLYSTLHSTCKDEGRRRVRRSSSFINCTCTYKFSQC